MKALIAAVLAATSISAVADTWEIPNQNGGKIVLQDFVCVGKGGKRYEGLRSMFAVNSGGKTISGCWYVSEGWVHVTYEDATEYTYPASSFRQIKSGNKGTST